MTYLASTDKAEHERVRNVDRLLIDGTPAERQFDQITDLARDLFRVPIALVSIIGNDRQWLKSCNGLSLTETPRGISFCTVTITSADLLIVPDATKDSRFEANPLVLGEPFIRFYAGAPLITTDGFGIGSLCIIDTVPRPALTPAEQRHLAALADICIGEIERRRLLIQTRAAKGFAEATTEVVLFCRPDGTITYVNKAAINLLGFTPDELVGRDISSFIPDRFIIGHKAGMTRVAKDTASHIDSRTFEATVRHREGREVPVDLALKVWRDEDGLNIGAILTDISERKLRESKLLHLAHTDLLTGLMRANAFKELVSDKIKDDARATILLLDLNGFKSINDSLGHAAGDALLKALSIRLLGITDRSSTLARLGGDEFGVFVPDVADPTVGEALACQIQSALSEPFDVNGHKLFVGVSIGCAIAPRDAIRPSDLIAAADLALYKAKSTRGRAFRFFEEAMRDESREKRSLHDEVRAGLERDEFVMHYQPLVLIDGLGVVAAEALMRWRHPERGLLLPEVFLPAMENTSLALSAGYWSLEQACRCIARWQTERRSPIRIGVNLFAAQLRHGNLIMTLEELIEKYGFKPELLELEITESIACQDDAGIIAILKRVRDLGVGIALDDFGTGYASLRTLKYVPATTVKIDQSFVRDLVVLREDAAIISAIMHVARSLDLRVVAEGVETKKQEAFLRAMGCHIGQGYLYGRPADVNAFEHGEVRTALISESLIA